MPSFRDRVLRLSRAFAEDTHLGHERGRDRIDRNAPRQVSLPSKLSVAQVVCIGGITEWGCVAGCEFEKDKTTSMNFWKPERAKDLDQLLEECFYIGFNRGRSLIVNLYSEKEARPKPSPRGRSRKK